jgi:hypothetical protein
MGRCGGQDTGQPWCVRYVRLRPDLGPVRERVVGIRWWILKTEPGIPPEELQPVSKVANREVTGLRCLRKLVPFERCRDRCLRQCARRVCGNRSGATVVSEVIYKDASPADSLRDRGDLAVWPIVSHRLCDRRGERLCSHPARNRLDRSYDMASLPT